MTKKWKTIEYDFSTPLGTSRVDVEVWDTEHEGIYFKPKEEQRLERLQAEKYMAMVAEGKVTPTDIQTKYLKRVLSDGRVINKGCNCCGGFGYIDQTLDGSFDESLPSMLECDMCNDFQKNLLKGLDRFYSAMDDMTSDELEERINNSKVKEKFKHYETFEEIMSKVQVNLAKLSDAELEERFNQVSGFEVLDRRENCAEDGD